MDGGRVANEGGGHLESPGRDVAHSGLDVVWDPLHEVGGVLVLDVQHLLVHLNKEEEGEKEKNKRRLKDSFDNLKD